MKWASDGQAVRDEQLETLARSANRLTLKRGCGTRSHRPRALPIVDTWWANRNGHDNDHAAARCDPYQTRLRDEAFPG